MTTTKVIFNIPVKLKKAAAARAKEKGITLTTLFTQTAQAFVEGEIDVAAPRLRPVVERHIRRTADDYKKGKNLSPRFDTATDALHWLQSTR